MKLRELLDPESKVSSMRFALVSVVYMCFFLVLCVGSYIIISVLKEAAIDWSGVAALMASLSLIIGAAAGGKALQKKTEIK